MEIEMATLSAFAIPPPAEAATLNLIEDGEVEMKLDHWVDSDTLYFRSTFRVVYDYLPDYEIFNRITLYDPKQLEGTKEWWNDGFQTTWIPAVDAVPPFQCYQNSSNSSILDEEVDE